jgi:CRISPR-associated protein Cas6
VIDLVFPLAGRSLPRDHRLALAEAVEALAPWLADTPGAGPHPVNLVQGAGEPALLSQRARLVLRVPRARADELGAALAGRTLDIAGHLVQLGAPHARELLPHGTLYAHFVAAAPEVGDDEAAFLDACHRDLDALGADSRRICGRRQRIRAGLAEPLVGYSLMLHGLASDDALRVLQAGVGTHRRLGCGLFVPHKSAAAVGL